MIYAIVATLFAATALAQCPIPTVERDTFQAEILSTSGLSILNDNTLLTLDLSFSRDYDLTQLFFKECVDTNGDPVPFSDFNVLNDAGSPQVTNGNVEVVDPDNNCQKLVTASIDYLEYCNFNVEDSADGETTTFSGELTLQTEISFTSPFEFTRNVERPMLFFITFDRTFSVTTSIEVFNPNQCEDSTDCNGYPCVMDPVEGIKKCNCTNDYGTNQGQHCETDNTCPTFTDCPDGTVTVVPLVTALPGLLSQVLNNAPTYNDNQLSGNIYASRMINGVSLTTSPTGTDDLLSYQFPLGVTDVTYTARDEIGNECECNFQVNVTDALAPVVDCPPDLITNVWNSWAEPSGTDLIDNNIHFWVEINGVPTAPATLEASYEEFCEGRPGAQYGDNHGQYHFYAPNWGFTHLDENGAIIPNSVIMGYMAERTKEFCTNDSRCIGYYISDSWTNIFFASTSDCLTVCNENPTRLVHPFSSDISTTCQQSCVDRHNAPGPFDEATDKPCHQASYGNEMTYVKILQPATTTTLAPTTTTTTTTTTEAPQDLWDCNCASVLGEANVWSDYSPYDSYTLDASAGDIQRVVATENGCPSTPYTAADFPTVSQVASFMVDRTPNAHTLWAFENTLTFQGNSAIAHGIFCPTVDPNFWYNAGEDAFIWYNNGEWSIGKPSVTWIADSQATTTCATFDSNVCGSG